MRVSFNYATNLPTTGSRTACVACSSPIGVLNQILFNLFAIGESSVEATENLIRNLKLDSIEIFEKNVVIWGFYKTEKIAGNFYRLEKLKIHELLKYWQNSPLAGHLSFLQAIN